MNGSCYISYPVIKEEHFTICKKPLVALKKMKHLRELAFNISCVTLKRKKKIKPSGIKEVALSKSAWPEMQG
jgi:hypothetical protein